VEASQFWKVRNYFDETQVDFVKPDAPAESINRLQANTMTAKSVGHAVDHAMDFGQTSGCYLTNKQAMGVDCCARRWPTWRGRVELGRCTSIQRIVRSNFVELFAPTIAGPLLLPG